MSLLESTVARWHIQGWNAAFREGFVVFDDRILNAEIIRRLPKCPDRIVLGSSRCMQLRQENFPGESFFNHSMRRGVLEDTIALWQLYRQRGWKPKHVMIGVDAWLLDGGYWKTYWLELRSAFGELRRDWNLPYPSTSDQWKADFAAKHRADAKTANHWKRLAAAALSWSGAMFFKTDKDGLPQYVRRSDGSVSYHASFRERPAAQVMETIQKSARFPRHPVSDEMVTLLDGFLAGLKKDGVQIDFVIPPHHPTFYRLGGTNSFGNSIEGHGNYLESLGKTELTIRRLAEKHQAQVLGSFGPFKVKAGEDEFFDWMHPKPPVFERMIRG